MVQVHVGPPDFWQIASGHRLLATPLHSSSPLGFTPGAREHLRAGARHGARGLSRQIGLFRVQPLAKQRFQTIDEYIESFPVEVRSILEQVRQAIHQTAPAAEESISYQIPTFKLDGKYLVYFSGWKNHISLYPQPVSTGSLDEELTPYKSGRGTLKFPLEKPLPLDLVRKVVAALIADNQAKTKTTSAPTV